MESPDLQTVVFLGPTCSQDRVRAILPEALIAPPVRRGDLYKYRLLNFSVFVMFDGVFANQLAVSPREVVDVLRDGAAVIGAASMGALRAVDCGPAGAIGHGRVFRLFRRRVLSSEDEVAVAFLPEAPYPVISLALINVRFALRRTHRAGLLSHAEALALARAAESLRYQDRNWNAIAGAARINLSPQQLATLRSCDVKREDVLSCCRSTAARLRLGKIAAFPRPDRKQPLGSLFQERERVWDPLDGEDPDEIHDIFLNWLWLSGQAAELADPNALSVAIEQGDLFEFRRSMDIRKPSAELEALLLRFIAFRRSAQLVKELQSDCKPEDLVRARERIACAHGARDWDHLIGRYGTQSKTAERLQDHAAERARIDVLARDILHKTTSQNDATIPVWKRSLR
jgi:hypothetical protein